MTLLSRIASAGRTIELWPVETVVTSRDVVIADISLTELARAWGTPCVHSAESVIVASGGRPTPSERTAVLVVAVTEVARDARGNLVIGTDARLEELRLVWPAARLIGRRSFAPNSNVLVCRDAEMRADDAFLARLPRDLKPGDLIAIPSRRIATDWRLRPHPLTGTASWMPAGSNAKTR
jgi:hypothetical protein